MIITNEIINSYIKNKYDYYVEQYGSNRILGTFLIGIGNYGFAEDVKELQSITIYLPSFEELCIGSTIKADDLIDIRTFYNLSNINYDLTTLELLYSHNSVINIKYKDAFEKNFLSNREILARYSPKERLSNALKRARKAFEEDNLFEGVRLSIAAKIYLNEEDCDKCFHIKDSIYINYLWSCKHYSTAVDINNIIIEMTEMYNDAKEDKNCFADTLIKEGIVELVTEGLKENVSLDAFENCLTQTEQKAWKNLKTSIHDGTGIISISKIVEETNISRPIFKNLLLKLESNNIAKVENQGVKGTYIKMLI